MQVFYDRQMVQPNRVITESYQSRTWKFLTFRAGFEILLLDATVNVALLAMFRRGAFLALTIASMAAFVKDIVNTCTAVQAARSRKIDV